MLTHGLFCPWKDTWQCLGTFSVVTIGGGVCWRLVGRARDDALGSEHHQSSGMRTHRRVLRKAPQHLDIGQKCQLGQDEEHLGTGFCLRKGRVTGSGLWNLGISSSELSCIVLASAPERSKSYGFLQATKQDTWIVSFFFFNYSMNCITFIVVQWSSQPNFIAFPSQTLSPSLHPRTSLLWELQVFQSLWVSICSAKKFILSFF